MQKLFSLLFDRLNHLGMAVPCRTNGNAGSEVQEYIIIHVVNPNPLTLFHHKGISPRVRRRNICLVRTNQLQSFRTGKCRFDHRILHLYYSRKELADKEIKICLPTGGTFRESLLQIPDHL
jgi:hypothetical protein